MTNNELQLLVGIDLEDQKAKNKLNEFLKKKEITTEIMIDDTKALQTLTTYVNKIGQAFQTLKFSQFDNNGNIIATNEEIRKVSDSMETLDGKTKRVTTSTNTWKTLQGQLVTQIRTTTAQGENLVKTIVETEDALGGVTTVEKVVNETTNELISSTSEYTRDTVKLQQQADKLAESQRKIAQAEKERMQNTSTMTTQTNEMYKGYRALVTTTKELNSKGEILNTVTREYTNNAGYAVKETDKFDASGKKVQGTVTEMSKGLQTAKQGFSDIIAKVTKFYLATLPIKMVRKALSEAVTTVKEFDEAVTELQKVSNLNGESLDAYTEKLSKLGSEVARTTTEMVDMATNMKKAGFSDEESAILAQLAGLYQNTADEELSASEATSVLVSQMKAFNYTANDAMHITDAINKVSQEFAVSSGDIGKGLTQAGASLSTYGNSFDETIGLITAGEYFLPVTDLIDGNGEVVTPFCNILILWKPNALHTNLSW